MIIIFTIMEEEKEAIELFQKLGFSRNEALVYIRLLKHGPQTARSLSKLSGVPYSKVYEIIQSLSNRGFVTILESRPRKFAAIDPEESLPVYIKTLIEELKSVERRLLEILREIKASRDILEERRVLVIRDQKVIAAKVAEAISNARTYVKLSGPMRLIEKLKPELSKAVRRGISVRVISPEDPGVEGIERKRMNMLGGGIIVDRREVIILLKEGDSFIAVYSDHPSLALLAETYYETLRIQSRDTS